MDAEATQEQLIEATQEIITSRYSPAEKTTEDSRLMTTAQVQTRINEFASFNVGSYIVYRAMRNAGFKISGVGEKFYWVMIEK